MSTIVTSTLAWRRCIPSLPLRATRQPVTSPRCGPCPGFRRHQHAGVAERSHLPRLVQPSMWELIIPPSVRQKTKELFRPSSKRPSNPATYFIWIYLFIGSQAIRIISVKNEYKTYTRKADLQIEKLREVVRKLQAGEPVDVEKVLGTGVPEEEEAWEEALREIESEEQLWQRTRTSQREDEERRTAEKARAAAEQRDANPVNEKFGSEQTSSANINAKNETDSGDRPPPVPGFY